VAQSALIAVGPPQNAQADEFIKQSVIFETRVLAHLDKGVPLDRFKVLVMPANLPKLAAEQEARLNRSLSKGRVIIRDGKARAGIAARAEAAVRWPGISFGPHGYVLGQLTRKPDGRTLILHLLNYDHRVPAENVRIRLELSGLVRDLSRLELKVLSSDEIQPQLAGLSALKRHRVHCAPDRALYCGDFLGQGGAVVYGTARASCFTACRYTARLALILRCLRRS
jgi:hypothetical protein